MNSSLKNKIVFFGTPGFAAEVFRFLHHHGVLISAVVTQPDRPRGRSLQVSFSPVKQAVLELNPALPIFQPEKASEETFLGQLETLRADLFVVVAYGQILSQRLLSIPPLGCINVHASLLPHYRGAAPIQRCLLAGETKTGIAIQKMVKQLDAGDVIATSEVLIPPEMTFGELEQILCVASQELLLDVLFRFEKGIPEAVPQDHKRATFAPKIELEEGEIHWNQSADSIHNLIRAFSPRPGAWCWLEPGLKRLKVLKSRVVDRSGFPGAVLSREGLVACGSKSILLLEVQSEGKKAMAAADWLRGAPGLVQFP